MKKTASMNTPARRRLRSRFSDMAPGNAGGVDASASEPQPTTSQSEKPTTTRPRARPAAKKTNSARQKKRRGVVPLKPETEPLRETTSAAPEDHAVGDEMDVDPAPVADSSTIARKGKAPRLYRQGSRSSARLMVGNPTAIHESMQIEPEVKQAKRERESDDEGTNGGAPVELAKKRAKLADDQTDTPLPIETDPPLQIETDPPLQTETEIPSQTETETPPQIETAMVGDSSPVEPASGENPTEDKPKQPVDVAAEESTAANSPDDEYVLVEVIKRFYLHTDDRGRVSMRMGLFRRDEWEQAEQAKRAEQSL
ncbi:hypothetical protein BJ322DRAFT_621438 [Thelephora terrestris]|uniref:Uncharacterized protein n=1 Tax=Thelephora terrestris TaxID=56493 RepID=A0A9P6L9P1_9AGAM|nr:hypothetical protein BJ322DRAFT_621438 [Thelephora terrestris]